ncbi:MAG: O-antigen ligase family protein [Acidimicrobiales bacterium]
MARESVSTLSTHRLLRAAAVGLLGVVVASGVVLTGAASSRSAALALGFGVAFCGAAAAIRFRGALLVLVPVAAYGVERLGPASANLSVADGVLLAGLLAAVPFVPWESRWLRRILLAAAAYEAMLACVVVAHPTARAIVEWGHRILLVVGAVLVGASLARLGEIAVAVRLYLAGSLVVAVDSIAVALRHHFAPSYPFGIQKNDAGLLLAYAFVIAIGAPGLARVPKRYLNFLRIVLVVGLVCTQARGPMIAATIVVVALQLRGHRSRRATVMVVVASLLMAGGVLAVTEGQIIRGHKTPGVSKFYGVGAREVTYKQALTIWSHDMFLGAGLRYFRDPTFQTTEPHDLFVEGLAESGVFGVLALGVLLGATWLALRRLDSDAAVLARCLLVMQFTAGLADIYWVAGRASFPWMLVGMAVGVDAMRIRRARQDQAGLPAGANAAA